MMKTIYKTLAVVVLVALAATQLFAQGTIYNGVLTISEGTTNLAANAFRENTEIKSVVFPSSLKSIGRAAFYICVYIDDNLVLPNGLEKIGDYAFDRCVNIKKITVPETVKIIGKEAFHTNTILVVKKNSVAHKWAVENNRDYQYSESGLPVGVSEVYSDYFMKTAWNQEGRDFTPGGERIQCQNLASAVIAYEMGFHYQGSHFYQTTEDTYYLDFDKNPCDYCNFPRYLYDDSDLSEINKLLWQQCILEERPWGNSKRVDCKGSYTTNVMLHAPVRTKAYTEDNPSEAEEMLKRNFKLHRPVRMYSYGTTSEGEETSHVWVLDGARMKNGKFQVHCDFGWYGKSNGWYNLWDPILDFNSGAKKMVEYIPLEGEELKVWKPARVSDADMKKVNSAVKLPTKFDPRTLSNNYLTPIKDQSPWSTCWSFSAMATMEMYAKKNGYGEFDLSERNLFAPLDYLNQLGFIGYKITAMYFLSHKGPVLENQDPYSSKVKPTEKNASKQKFAPAFFIDQSRTLPGTKSEDFTRRAIKEAILDYGAVIAHDMQKDEYLSSSDATFYNSKDKGTNHAITLVGWDDDKVITGGTASGSCPGKGAWIVKNSFGTKYGESGYFYLSYYDLSGVSATCYFFPSLVPYDKEIQIYDYDELSQTTAWYSKTSASYALVKFTTSNKAQYLTKIGTFALTPDTDLEFTVYKTKNGNKLTDEIASIPMQNCKLAGYYSFDIDNPVLLEANSTVYIKIKYMSDSYSRLPVEKFTDKVKAVIEKDKCWVSSDGVTWLAAGADVSDRAFDICAKIYTYTGEKSNIKKSGANNATINPTTEVTSDSVVKGILTISATTTKIEDCAYMNNTEITKVIIHDGVTSIGVSAFESCPNLTEITIPKNIERLGNKAFANCSKLKIVYFNADNCTYGGSPAESSFKDCSALSEVIIGNNVKVIPPQIFRGCASITELTIPSNAENVGITALYSTGLKKVVIENGVKTLGNYVFSNCKALKEIVLPSTITSIGNPAIPKNVKVYCPAGSYAETWAKQNGNTIVNN